MLYPQSHPIAIRQVHRLLKISNGPNLLAPGC